jgi:hypothetical protein
MSVKIINRHPKSDNSKLKSDVGTLLNDYLDHSTIQGVDYIFNSKEKLGGKIFWMVVVSVLLFLSVYGSWIAYRDWQDKPVLTSVLSTGLPIEQVSIIEILCKTTAR